ncbi:MULTISPECIES: hypothetical protein [unclassified Bradyrhizobium]|uniref:hypothetical protein n=1 Tax=unclassified Bradyrhizobium TaxID=2631580 RepID=UPI0029163796|nr:MULTISPECIES: hypothetical protein [unclassified Bradyrhizobium]
MTDDVRATYLAAAHALLAVERQIEAEQRNESPKRSELRARLLDSLEAKASRMRIALIPLKAAYDALTPRDLGRFGAAIHWPGLTWHPVGTATINDAAGDIPAFLRRSA